MSDALKKAFGYKWHSSSYLSSQRVLKEGKFEVSDDYYRKFVVPDDATVYTADIVASGVSIDNGIDYIYNYMQANGHMLKNFFFITIGCVEAERVLARWHKRFKETFPDYGETLVIYPEGRFGLATENTPLTNKIPLTDLIKSYKEGALLSPEYEHSQFDRVITALEACAIYDGGKKGFEPINHIKDILEFWEKQHDSGRDGNWSTWEEYNLRLPLDMYFADIAELEPGDAALLKANKQAMWEGLNDDEYVRLHARFSWLWTTERIRRAAQPASLLTPSGPQPRHVPHRSGLPVRFRSGVRVSHRSRVFDPTAPHSRRGRWEEVSSCRSVSSRPGCTQSASPVRQLGPSGSAWSRRLLQLS